MSGGKKIRKFYVLVADRWNLADKIEKDRFLEYKNKYFEIVGVEDLAEKKTIVAASREYLQPQFRRLEIREHILEHKEFWALPDGPLLVSSQFEWVTGGSGGIGWLAATIQGNLQAVLEIVIEVMSAKLGEVWKNMLEKIEESAELVNGNEVMVMVFLLREWTRMYKEKPSHLIFLEGEDVVKDVSDQSYVHVREVHQPGEDFEKKVVISVMSGNTMIFENIGFSEALAAVIEIYFIFNHCYDRDVDSSLNFIQRVLGGFGDLEGARNAKGNVKSSYTTLQAEFGKVLVDRKLGVVTQSSSA